jgi:hypothetical protein
MAGPKAICKKVSPDCPIQGKRKVETEMKSREKKAATGSLFKLSFC